MTIVPINCDLGEGESPELSQQLLGLVDEANIACGGHAGDADSMRFCLELARTNQVSAGAHPGIPDRTHFGRQPIVELSVSMLVDLLEDQIGRFRSIAREAGVSVEHIKLHGALYHRVDADPELGQAYLNLVAQRWPDLALVSRAGGGLARLGETSSLRVKEEAFLDRAYRPDGTLVPRTEPGAVLHDPGRVMGRIRDLQERGGWWSIDDCWISLDPDTLCVHGDTSQAVAMLTELRKVYPRCVADRPSRGCS